MRLGFFLLFVFFLEVMAEESRLKMGVETSAKTEMELYREILNREVATRQDLYDLLAMQFLEFEKEGGPQKRNKALAARGITLEEDTAQPVSRGEVARALLEAYDFEKGWLFWLTRWEFYAMRDIQQLGIMEDKYTFHQKLTGRQLVAILTKAQEAKERQDKWQK
ncbi:MAG: hypothetical protein NZM25_09070 [Leptospiraceae bacterium]|nr:hypothetical protein [Leptospiraceae bacterium]MDW8307290.1 hypothetical protein [Leptospiraceae bacterium]